MTRIDSKINSKFDTQKIGSTIDKAEEAVQNSINRFETAMEHLAEKVEGTSQKIHHVRDVAKDSKEKLMHLKDEVQATIDPLRPYVAQVRNVSRKALGRVRSAPRPVLWAAVGILGWAAYQYFKKSGHDPLAVKGKADLSSEYSSEFPYQ